MPGTVLGAGPAKDMEMGGEPEELDVNVLNVW